MHQSCWDFRRSLGARLYIDSMCNNTVVLMVVVRPFAKADMLEPGEMRRVKEVCNLLN